MSLLLNMLSRLVLTFLPRSKYLLISWLLLLSHFSHVRFFATPWAVARMFLCPWHFPGKNTGVGCYFLLQGIFPTQGSNYVSYDSYMLLLLLSRFSRVRLCATP